jgi:hypothetical protein
MVTETTEVEVVEVEKFSITHTTGQEGEECPTSNKNNKG